jgi:hypothetical protein
MKLLAGLLLLTLSFTSCDKLYPGNCGEEKSSLTGKWKYVEQFTSNGGPGTWHAAQPEGQKIEFKRDGGFKGSGSFHKEATRYELLGTDRVKVSPASNEVGYVIMGYTLSNSNNELQLFPLEPSRCIEGCASKFLRD